MSIKPYHYTESGLPNIYLKNGFEYRNTSYGEAVSIFGMENLHKAIGLDLVNLTRKLNGKEVRFLRIELDFSQKALGRILGVEAQTVARWEKDQVDIPQADDLVLRMYYKEVVSECGELKNILERITDIDQEISMLELYLEESTHEWKTAA